MAALCLQLVCAGCGSVESEADTRLYPGPCVVERSSASGSVNSRTEYAYDDRGNVVRVERERYPFDFSSVTLYVYNDDGRMLSIDTNGVIVEAWHYDDRGDLVSHEREMRRSGEVGQRITYIRFPNGAVQVVEVDGDPADYFCFGCFFDPADGVPDYRREYIYDFLWRLDLIEYDFDADGTTDATRSHEYDGYDPQPRVVRMDRSDGGWEWETFDETGRPLAQEYTCSDTSVACHRFQWTYHGNRVVKESINGDGELLYKETSNYDDRGNLLRMERYFAYLDQVTALAVYEYDAHDNLLSELHVGINTGAELESHTYDMAGNILTTAEDRDADGSVEARTSFSYSCW